MWRCQGDLSVFPHLTLNYPGFLVGTFTAWSQGPIRICFWSGVLLWGDIYRWGIWAVRGLRLWFLLVENRTVNGRMVRQSFYGPSTRIVVWPTDCFLLNTQPRTCKGAQKGAGKLAKNADIFLWVIGAFLLSEVLTSRVFTSRRLLTSMSQESPWLIIRMRVAGS